MSDKLVSKQEAAQILGVSERTISRYLNAGRLRGAIIGKAWRIKESDVQAFFEEMREQTAEALKTKQKGGNANDQ